MSSGPLDESINGIDAPRREGGSSEATEYTEEEEETTAVGVRVVESDTLEAQQPSGELPSASVQEEETSDQNPTDSRDRNAAQTDIDNSNNRINNDDEPLTAAASSGNDNENSAAEEEGVQSAKRVCMPCLRCDACDNVLCVREDLYKEVAATFSDQVYTYNLEILGGEAEAPVLAGEEEEDAPSQIQTPTSPLPNHYPVYSATNPSAVRFDVVRVASGCYDKKLIACSVKQFSAQHSWFPPYYWCMASCASCGQHLGWGFAEVDVEGTERLKSEFEAKRIEELKRLKAVSDEKAKKKEIKMRKGKEGLAKAGLPLSASIDASMKKGGNEQRESESDRRSNSSSSRRKRARADTTEASAPTTAATSVEGKTAEPLLSRGTHVDPHACSNDEKTLLTTGDATAIDHFISENEETENSRERARSAETTAATAGTGESQCNAHELNDNDNDNDEDEEANDGQKGGEEEEASGADDDDDGSWEDICDQEGQEHEGTSRGGEQQIEDHDDDALDADDEGEDEEDYVDDSSDDGESDMDEAKSRTPSEIKSEVLKSIPDASLHPFYHQLPPSYQRTKPFVNGGDGLVFKPIAFIGLILTRCRAVEDGTAEQVTENLTAAYRRSFQNAVYHSQRRELYDMLNSLPNELRGLANRIGMVALTIHQNYGARNSMTDIINQTRNVAEQSRAMAHTLRANRSPLENNSESDHPSSSSSAAPAPASSRHVDSTNREQAEEEATAGDTPTAITAQQREVSVVGSAATPHRHTASGGGEEGGDGDAHAQRRAVDNDAEVHQREGEEGEEDDEEEEQWESCDEEGLAS